MCPGSSPHWAVSERDRRAESRDGSFGQGPVGQVTVWGLRTGQSRAGQGRKLSGHHVATKSGSETSVPSIFAIFFAFPKACCGQGQGAAAFILSRALGIPEGHRRKGQCFPIVVGVEALHITESILEGPQRSPSQWASHVAADQNRLWKKTHCWGPCENNYSEISGRRSWEPPPTLTTRTQDSNPVVCSKHLNLCQKPIQPLPEPGEKQLPLPAPNCSLQRHTSSSVIISICHLPGH